MKNIIIILTGILLFTSCIDKQTAEKNARIIQSLNSVYNTTNIEITNGKRIGSTTGPYIEVKLDDCEWIDNNSVLRPEQILTSIAIITYDVLKEYTTDTTYRIDVSYTKTTNGEDQLYESNYPYLITQKMLVNVLVVKNFIDFLNKKQFEEAYNLFNDDFKKTNPMDEFVKKMTQMEKQIGEITEHTFLGYTFNEIEANNSKYDVMVADFILVGKEKKNAQFFFNLKTDEEKILGINL